MLLAHATLDEKIKWNSAMNKYVFGNLLLYIIIVVIGMIITIQFLISFELMLLFLTPTILFLLIFNIRKYQVQKSSINFSLIIIWIFLILIIGLYFLYYMLSITEIL